MRSQPVDDAHKISSRSAGHAGGSSLQWRFASTRKTITNTGAIIVEGGATLTLSGTVSNTGTLFAGSGTLNIAGMLKGGTTLSPTAPRRRARSMSPVRRQGPLALG